MLEGCRHIQGSGDVKNPAVAWSSGGCHCAGGNVIAIVPRADLGCGSCSPASLGSQPGFPALSHPFCELLNILQWTLNWGGVHFCSLKTAAEAGRMIINAISSLPEHTRPFLSASLAVTLVGFRPMKRSSNPLSYHHILSFPSAGTSEATWLRREHHRMGGAMSPNHRVEKRHPRQHQTMK